MVLGIPTPGEAFSVARSATGWAVRSATTAAGVPGRLLGLVDGAEDLVRRVRSVVDRADELIERTSRTVEDVQGEVDRYCAWPGQACGYKVGHGEIVRLRAQAQQALGDKFDFRLFNDAVVKGGGVPMTVLAKNVDAYVAGRKGA